MADDRIEIEIVLDDGSIQKGFTKIRGEANKTGKSISKSFKGALGKDIGKPFDVAKSSVFALRTAVVGLVGVLAGGAFLRSVTVAASQQQDAVNALNVSLRSAGTFSQEASESFQALARGLQANSKFGDEVILQQAALARNYARTNEEAEKLVSVSVDLAEATGISLDSAVRNLGKTFSGLQGELGESLPALRNLTAEQLKAGGALDLVAGRFAGSALGATRTFSGALAQLSNTFGDLLESIGSAVTSSPAVITLFNALSKTFDNLSQDLSGSGKGFDQLFKDIVLNSAAAANAVVDSFQVISQVPDFFKFAFLKAKLETFNFIQAFLVTIEPVSGFLDKIFGDAGASARNIQQNFQAIAEVEAQLESLGKSSIKGGEGFAFARKAIGDFTTTFQELSVVTKSASGGGAQSPVAPIVAAVDKDTEKLREQVAKLQTETQAAIQGTFFNSEDMLAETPSVFENLSGKGKEALTSLRQELQQTRDKTIQTSQQIGQAVNNGISNTISNAVSGLVKALAAGENGFEAFGKAALATIGDLAVQLGQTLIASGIGIEALKTLGGAAAIAAGVALVAVGTLISSFSGGAAVNPSGGSSVTPPLADLEPDGISDSVNQNASVQVNIEGNVFDGDETGLRIADILKDQGFNNAVVS